MTDSVCGARGGGGPRASKAAELRETPGDDVLGLRL